MRLSRGQPHPTHDEAPDRGNRGLVVLVVDASVNALASLRDRHFAIVTASVPVLADSVPLPP